MMRILPYSCKALLLGLFLFGMAVPVCAQGQSPTNPNQEPGLSSRTSGSSGSSSSSRFSGGSRFSNNNASSSGVSSSGLSSNGTSPSLGGARSGAAASGSSSSQQKSQQGKQQDGGAQQSEGAVQPPKPRGESGRSGGAKPTTIGGGRGGAAGAGAGASRNALSGGASGSRMGQGGGGTVSVSGTGVYEPVLERDPEYKPVPEVGEPLTLEGPMPVGEFLQAINLATNWNVLVSEAAKGVSLQFWISETPPVQALEILKFHDLYYEYDDKIKYLKVMTEEEYLTETYGDATPEEFVVVHADVAYIESVLSSLLSSTGRMITDQRTSHIYAWDTEDNLKQMRKTFKDLDVPLEKMDFVVRHAELADIEAVVSGMLSANGSIISDGRTGQFFVWDSATVLEKVSNTVKRLDVPVESATFEIVHLNAEDITEALEPLLSERGMIQVDPRYNALVVTDLAQRITLIGEMIAQLDKELETRTWVIKYADLDFIADQIETFVPDEMGEIVTNDEVHQITVTGLPARLDKIAGLIETWDVKRRQVLIEAYIVEVGSEVERAFNINWSYYGSDGNAPIIMHSGSGFDGYATPTGSGQAMSVGQLPYAIPEYGALEVDDSGNITRPLLTNIEGDQVIRALTGNNLSVTLDYLDKQRKATILSSPRVVVQDGEEAIFENATRVPYVSASTYFNNYSTTSRVNNTNRIEFIDVGTILTVLPRVTEELNILLDISAEDSTFEDKTIVANDQTSTVPEKTVRRAETQLRIHTGETVVLGGLRRDRATKSVTKTPLLGSLPLIGSLFRNPSRNTQKSSLLIFITTTVVDEFTHPETEELVHAVDDMAEDYRYNEKDFWGRLRYRLSQGENELSVSIGKTGVIFSEGHKVTLEELRKAFFELEGKSGVTVVLRRHPRSPTDVVTQVTELAMEADLDFEIDNGIEPVVPDYESAQTRAHQKTGNEGAPQASAEASAPAVKPVAAEAAAVPAAAEAAAAPAVAEASAAAAVEASAPAVKPAAAEAAAAPAAAEAAAAPAVAEAAVEEKVVVEEAAPAP